jgi:hypothetical protein
MQSTHQIIGLSKQEIKGHSYKTDDNIRIIHDENGKGTSITKMFSKYILYVGSAGHGCYSITLSHCEIASYRGRLGHIGSMEVTIVSQLDAQKNITHVPVKPLHICAELEEPHYIEEMNIGLSGEPTTTVFAFSRDGCDERIPRGYVYVNMELFTPLPL